MIVLGPVFTNQRLFCKFIIRDLRLHVSKTASKIAYQQIKTHVSTVDIIQLDIW